MKYQKLPWKIFMAYNRTREFKYWLRICNAPFKSLYFSFDGTVYSCCVNRTHALGRYPEHTLSEIWNGERKKQLARHINHRDLSLGCQGCQYYLEKGNFDDLRAKYYDFPKNNIRFPVFLEFELHNTCNLECIMCGGDFSSLIRKNREHRPPLPMVYDDRFVEQLSPFIPYLHRALFAGGEPFLIPVYYSIWEKIIEMNPACRIAFQSNGTVLNQKVKDILERGRFEVGLSIDSVNKEVYETIRVNSRMEDVINNARYFSEYCRAQKTDMHITACPMRINWRGIPDLVNFCNELNAYIRFNNVWYPPEQALWNLKSHELHEIRNVLEGYQFDGKGTVADENRRYYHNFLNQLLIWSQEALMREQSINL
jgi:radical SAM protein with 4Fe4S-binding SPASM domain